MNAGCMGMYNMGLVRVDQLKNAKKGELIDRIGREEMDAHLFCITQTDAKINRENIRGQKPLENAVRSVGKTVRETMTNVIGAVPVILAPAESIQLVKKLTGLENAVECGHENITPQENNLMTK